MRLDLRARRDSQTWRIEFPQIDVREGSRRRREGDGARAALALQRAGQGRAAPALARRLRERLRPGRRAATEILKLIGKVIERHEKRQQVKSARNGGSSERSTTVAETDKQGTTFDQASREATGARPYGRYLEDFEEGATYKHWPAKTVTEADDHLFCLITMNHHPLHINDVYAVAVAAGAGTWWWGRWSTRSRSACRSADISGKAIANLATEELSASRTRCSTATRCIAESEVLEVRDLRVQARSRRRQGAHRRLQPAQRAGRDLPARRAGPADARRLSRAGDSGRRPDAAECAASAAT